MGQEIERKFLVVGDRWRAQATGVRYRQGFLSTEPERTVRVRVAGAVGSITIKGLSVRARRTEFEYPIPAEDAEQILNTLCMRPLIEKVRYTITVGAHAWEVDVFEAENEGLIVAEIELGAEDEDFEMPEWIGAEVTDDPRYFNSNLVAKPYRAW